MTPQPENSLAATYRDVLQPHRRVATGVIAMWALSGLLEGLALTALVPLVGGAVGDEERSLSLLGTTLSGDSLRTAALAVFVTLGILSAAARLAAEAGGVHVTASVEHDMRRTTTSLLLRVKWSVFLSMRLGDVTTSMLAASTQTGLGAQWFLRGVGALIIAAVFLVFAVVIAFELSLISVGFATIAVLGYRFSSRRAEAHASELTRAASEIGDEVVAIFANLKFIRSTGDIARSEVRADEIFQRAASSYFRSQVFGPGTRAIFEAGALLFVGTILALTLLLEGTITAESVAFLALFYRLAPRVLVAQELLQLARTQRPWYVEWRDRIMSISSAQDTQAQGGQPTFEREIRAVNLTYTFPDARAPALRDVSWTLRRGQCLAVVGESGSGKTTMLDLVTGLLEPSGGDVAVDGHSLRELDLAAWQSHIGIVLQDTPLLHTTIGENVAWPAAKPDRDQTLEALQLANAMDFVSSLPAGIDTVVGERGSRLSGGQRQRIALARALYRQPWLLILDEATSALDAETEATVQRAIRSIKRQCAVLMVTHRLASVHIADYIIVLSDGHVVEEGPWDDLIAKPAGYFATVSSLQDLEQARQQ